MTLNKSSYIHHLFLTTEDIIMKAMKQVVYLDRVTSKILERVYHVLLLS